MSLTPSYTGSLEYEIGRLDLINMSKSIEFDGDKLSRLPTELFGMTICTLDVISNNMTRSTGFCPKLVLSPPRADDKERAPMNR